jgi:hypothetical protein
MDDRALREDICRSGHSLFKPALTPGLSGNIIIAIGPWRRGLAAMRVNRHLSPNSGYNPGNETDLGTAALFIFPPSQRRLAYAS